MEYVSHFIDLFLHLDEHLAELVPEYGAWTYLVLFVIVFCETGLVVTPFLPGDSLLFAAGRHRGAGSLNPHLLVRAAHDRRGAGRRGELPDRPLHRPGGLQAGESPVLQTRALRTQAFYDRYGGKTIVIARFVPIVRTFAPFLAGVGQMNYGQFAIYNVTGAIAWVVIGVYAGYFFGNVEFVKENFSLVIVAICSSR